MRRILHMVSTFQIKTDTKWLVRLLGKMNRDEFELVVGAFYDDGPVKARFDAMNIETFNLNVSRSWDPAVVLKLTKKIKYYQPALIHTHLLRADLYGGLAARLSGRKVVSTVYALGEYRRAHRRGWMDWWLDRMSAAWADRFIAVCHAIKDDLVDRVGVSSDRITVIHTGMDPIEVDPSVVENRRRELGISPEEKVVLVGARLSYEKGVDCFLRAVKILADRGVRARYLIAGSGPLEKELIEQASTLGLSDQVRFLGFVEEIEPLIKMADLVVMPSYSEGLPNMALETFALEKPLVASAVGGLPDLKKIDSEAILLCQPNNSHDLADKIFMTLKDFSLADKTARHGRRIIEGPLSTESVARRYENLYRSIMDQRHGKRGKEDGPV